LTSAIALRYAPGTMIDFSKIQEDEYVEDDDVGCEEEVYLRVALPRCVAEEDPSWRKLCLCILHPSVNFFDGFQKKQAKAICAECVVREQCLEFAMANKEEFGVWGGLDDLERKQLVGKGPRKRYR